MHSVEICLIISDDGSLFTHLNGGFAGWSCLRQNKARKWRFRVLGRQLWHVFLISCSFVVCIFWIGGQDVIYVDSFDKIWIEGHVFVSLLNSKLGQVQFFASGQIIIFAVIRFLRSWWRPLELFLSSSAPNFLSSIHGKALILRYICNRLDSNVIAFLLDNHVILMRLPVRLFVFREWGEKELSYDLFKRNSFTLFVDLFIILQQFLALCRASFVSVSHMFNIVCWLSIR